MPTLDVTWGQLAIIRSAVGQTLWKLENPTQADWSHDLFATEERKADVRRKALEVRELADQLAAVEAEATDA